MDNKTENKPKRGRPAKKKEKLNRSINIKLTGKDFDSVREKAGKLGLKATIYAREMTLKGGVKSRFTLEELDLVRKLSGMANNLNQIARKANQAGYENVSKAVYYLAIEIKKLLDDR